MNQERYNNLLSLMRSSNDELVGFCYHEIKNSSVSYFKELKNITVKGALNVTIGRNEMQKQGFIERGKVQGYDTLISNLKKLDPEYITRVYWLYSDNHLFSLYASNDDSSILGVLFHSHIRVNEQFIRNKILNSAPPVYKFRNGIYIDE